MKKFLLFGALALTVAFASCNNKQTKADATANDSVAVVSDTVAPSFVGEYEGTLPCADCPGIQTYLKLDSDTTYLYKQNYLERGDQGKVEQSGVFTINNDVITLITPSSGEKIYYKLLDGAVALSDSVGTLAEGQIGEFNKLKKK